MLSKFNLIILILITLFVCIIFYKFIYLHKIKNTFYEHYDEINIDDTNLEDNFDEETYCNTFAEKQICNKIKNIKNRMRTINKNIMRVNNIYTSTTENNNILENNKIIYDDLIDTIDRNSNLEYDYDQKPSSVNWEYIKEDGINSKQNVLYTGLSKYNNLKSKQLAPLFSKIMINYRYFQENNKLTLPQKELPEDGIPTT